MTITRRSFVRVTAAAAVSSATLLRARANKRTEEIKMEIKRIGSQPSSKGPAEWFTGTVRVDTPFKAEEPGRMSGAIVTFEPGARTNWPRIR